MHRSFNFTTAKKPLKWHHEFEFFGMSQSSNLINNPKMFNGETDDLAIKPCITQKKYFYEFVANVLRDNIGILIFDLHGGC